MANLYLSSKISRILALLILCQILQTIKTISFHPMALRHTQTFKHHQQKYTHEYQTNHHNLFFNDPKNVHQQVLSFFRIQLLPNKFIEEQYIYVQIQIKKPQGLIQFVMKIQKKPRDSLYYQFIEQVNSSSYQTKARMRVKIPKQGKYNYTIYIRQAKNGKVLGEGTQGYFQSININNAILHTNKPFNKVPTNVSLEVKANKLNLYLYQGMCQIAKLSFVQSKNISKTLYVTNSWGIIEIPFIEFQNFTQGDTSLNIFCAQASNISFFNINSSFLQLKQIIKFKAGLHKFQHLNSSSLYVNMSNIIWKIGLNQQFKMKGRLLTDLNENIQYFLQIPKPDLLTRSYKTEDYFKNKIIQKNGQIFKIKLKNQIKVPGVYILQILNNRKKEILNFPIYVGDFYPLIPDFQDKKPNQKVEESPNASLIEPIQDQPHLLFQMVNSERAKWNVCPLKYSQRLNKIGLKYSELMAQKQQAGHDISKSIEERTYQQFKKNFTTIGQNVVTEKSLVDAHFKLCRSPSHLMNIIDPNFTQIGFGVSINNTTKILYIVEEFIGNNDNINAQIQCGLNPA